jgi:hypothetical protein
MYFEKPKKDNWIYRVVSYRSPMHDTSRMWSSNLIQCILQSVIGYIIKYQNQNISHQSIMCSFGTQKTHRQNKTSWMLLHWCNVVECIWQTRKKEIKERQKDIKEDTDREKVKPTYYRERIWKTHVMWWFGYLSCQRTWVVID